MTEKEKELNLYQKIVEVRKSVGKISKDSTAGKGSKFSYQYVSESQILNRISDEMDNQNLLLFPNIINKSYQKEGNQYIVELDLMYKWINGDDPKEFLEIPYYAVGQQSDASKALGTALTYSNRYFLLKMFNLATDEDDADNKPLQQKQQQPYKLKQDDGKLELVRNNANVLSKILTSKGDNKSQDDILNAYMQGNNINNLNNQQLTELANRIKAKIEQYKKEDNDN